MANSEVAPNGNARISKFAKQDPNNSPGFVRYSWYVVYMAALFETDAKQIRARIAAAERALAERERQLFSSSEMQERTAVVAALHALQGLRDCLGPHKQT